MAVASGRATVIFQDTAVDTTLLISPGIAPNENAVALKSNFAASVLNMDVRAGAITKGLSIISFGLITAAMF